MVKTKLTLRSSLWRSRRQIRELEEGREGCQGSELPEVLKEIKMWTVEPSSIKGVTILVIRSLWLVIVSFS